MIETQQYVRKPLYVDAVRVTNANFEEIATWCQGEVLQDEVARGHSAKKYIKVRVHNPKNPRQTKAFVGDWLLYTERGYKVYTNKAFHASFDPTVATTTLIENVEVTSVGPVAANPSPETGVGPILGVGEPETHMTPQGEPIEMVPATPQAIADVVNEQQPTVPVSDGIEVADSPTAPPVESNGKRVLSLEEQEKMTPLEIRELIQTGEVVLAQDQAA
jgi:hypothetical protein